MLEQNRLLCFELVVFSELICQLHFSAVEARPLSLPSVGCVCITSIDFSPFDIGRDPHFIFKIIFLYSFSCNITLTRLTGPLHLSSLPLTKDPNLRTNLMAFYKVNMHKVKVNVKDSSNLVAIEGVVTQLLDKIP